MSEATTGTDPEARHVDPAVRARLDRLVDGSRRALLWERAWPALLWPLAVAAAFVVASALGLWTSLAPEWRRVGTIGFGLALVASLWPLLRLRIPSRAAALDRLDRFSGVRHGPARTLDDTLAVGTTDPGTRALWALHLRRAEATARSLRVAPPRPGMTRRDPHALRAAALVALAASLFVAGPEFGRRLGAAFDWRVPESAGPAFRVDGWVDPPHYTRLPPVMIDLASGEQRLRVPVGSTVVIRAAGRGDATLSPSGGLSPLAPETADTSGAATAAVPARPAPARPGPADLKETRFKLTAPGELAIATGLVGRRRLVLDAIPDRPPTIGWSAAPEPVGQGALGLTYRARDDYGIASAEALVEPVGPGGPATGRRTLVPAPKMPLALPGDPHADEDTRATAEVADHPWAGARVRLTLVARDEADQEGRSAPLEVTLPGRVFTKPLARALVEQRRALVLDPDRRDPVQLALDALLIAPDRFTPEPSVFLGLRVASERLRQARTDEDLVGVADWLWAMALQIEEGDGSEAERALKAAEQQLRDAMDRGAPQDEIKRLAEELRSAMDRFLREFAERMKNAPRDAEQTARGPERTITSDDLERMLNDMQEAMRRGDTAEAQRLLDQLKNLLDNLRTARPGSRPGDPMNAEMERGMQELDAMAREQQELRDETFKQGQGRPGGRGADRGRDGRQAGRQPGGRQPGQKPGGQQPGDGEDSDDGQGGQGGQPGRSGQGSLGQRQGALRDRLGQLQRRMRGMGMQGEQGLADAEGAMGEAENQLGQGRDGQAVDSQGRALDGLQRGMQGMAQQMQQMMGQGDGEGDPNGPGNPQGRASNDPRDDDPLGRPTRSRDFSDGRVRIPGANESAVERAARILEELRRKLGDPNRPREELDYFERLLKRN